ncbi:MetQ/NlpA family ABC transporter substrate-binding protein [Streptococcus himalayensis]|uniref:Lipoprotein n=1 Tax=Streptococcus himalayensis TaxID=1888195 RepID=A0A917A6X3_9STRE|nr:MetQ/NlpA family ABC transporter substrate-binding protein [Streptococcus himalayensis]GGE32213.1 lipoprotein [Streptococcus himalayensis]
MNFKKLLTFAFVGVAAATLTACGSSNSADGGKDTKITVVASPAPHAEILEAAKPILEKEGYSLDINIVNDYVTPNKIVFDGDADANFFQHTPYLEKFNKENNQDLVSVGNVHIEPLAIYSKKYKSIKDLPENATVYASTNPAEVGRFIDLFVKNGLMTLKDGVDPVTAQLTDIAENKKNIQIKTEIAPEFLVKTYENNEGDAVIINSNFAIDAKLSPVKDSIAIEDESSPYANLIAVKPADKDKDKIKALIKVLQSDDIKKFIEDTYKDGSVIPAK